MFDILSFMIFEDWEEDEIADANTAIAEYFMNDFEAAIIEDPESSWNLNANGQIVAHYTGYADRPEHGLTYNDIMDYNAKMSFGEFEREDLKQKIEEVIDSANPLYSSVEKDN